MVKKYSMKNCKRCYILADASKFDQLSSVKFADFDQATILTTELYKPALKKYKNIVVIHKKNGGLTSAWKAGVTAATGDLLGFVDSDDWIDPDMYERLYETMERYDADLSMAGLVFDYEDKNYPPRREGNRLEQEFYDEQSWHCFISGTVK